MRKTCEICEIRPQMNRGEMNRRYGVAFPYCEACLAKCDWENTHSDYGHDADGPAVADDHGATSGGRVAGCWVCYPELDETSSDYHIRKGTSRAGMKINVPLRASGPDKAAHVAAFLPAHVEYVIRTIEGNTTLTAGGLRQAILVWDVAGRFIYGPSTVGGKKVRNLAAALRALQS